MEKYQKCQYCGKRLEIDGPGRYWWTYQECSCAPERRKKAAEEAARNEELRIAREAACSHVWTLRVQDFGAYHHCDKCGRNRE